MSNISEAITPELLNRVIPDQSQQEYVGVVLKTLELDDLIDELDTGNELDQMVALTIAEQVWINDVREREDLIESETECYQDCNLKELHDNYIIKPNYESLVRDELNNGSLLEVPYTRMDGSTDEFYIYDNIEDCINDKERAWNALSEEEQAAYEPDNIRTDNSSEDILVSDIARAYSDLVEEPAFARFIAESYRENIWGRCDMTKEQVFDNHIIEYLDELLDRAKPGSQLYDDLMSRFEWDEDNIIENALSNANYSEVLHTDDYYIRTPEESLQEVVNQYAIEDIREELLENMPLEERLYHACENPDLLDTHEHHFDEVTPEVLDQFEFARALERPERKAYIRELANHITGENAIEAVELPEIDFNFAEALENAYQQSQASKGKDKELDRDR